MGDFVESSVVTVLREYRLAMDGREQAVIEEMAAYWLEIEKRLEADISALALEIQRRVQSGEEVTEQIIWRMDRYRIIQRQLEDQIHQFNTNQALRILTKAQEGNALMGIQAAQDAIQVSFKEIGAVGPYWTRLNLNAIESMIGFAGDGSPLLDLLRKDYPDAVDGLLKALINGVARGLNPAQIAREMVDGMGMGLERALLIARTEIARAYRRGSVEQYRKSGVVSGFMRLVKKETACMACLALDGEKFELEEELDDHPRGKCVVVPMVKGVDPPAWETGLVWFRGLSPEQQEERLGSEKYSLWLEGVFKLQDLVRYSRSDAWGASPRVATIDELRNH